MAELRSIHDFSGSPDELFAFDYPAPGSPDVAAEVVEVVKPRWVGLDYGSRASITPRGRCSPTPSRPQTSRSCSCPSNGLQPLEYHLDIARRLAPLRERGVLIVGSGNVVHNLRRLDWSNPVGGFD